jgi:hypothetical protein
MKVPEYTYQHEIDNMEEFLSKYKLLCRDHNLYLISGGPCTDEASLGPCSLYLDQLNQLTNDTLLDTVKSDFISTLED